MTDEASFLTRFMHSVNAAVGFGSDSVEECELHFPNAWEDPPGEPSPAVVAVQKKMAKQHLAAAQHL